MTTLMMVLLLGCPGGGDTGPTTPTFTQVQADILTPSCAFSTCHGGASPAQGLSLESGSAYAAIVGVPASLDASVDLVAPGDATSSYLYLKCAADPAALGDEMPPGTGLDADRLAELAAWIDAGAPND